MWTLLLRRIFYIHYESFVSPDKLLTQVLLILPYSLVFYRGLLHVTLRVFHQNVILYHKR